MTAGEHVSELESGEQPGPGERCGRGCAPAEGQDPPESSLLPPGTVRKAAAWVVFSSAALVPFAGWWSSRGKLSVMDKS